MGGGANLVKGCTICTLGLALVTGVVTALAFTIKALVDDWHVEPDSCAGSHMRVYLVTLLVVGTVVGCLFGRKRSLSFGGSDDDGDDDDEEVRAADRRRNAVRIATAVAFAVWGWVEAFANACDTVTGTVSEVLVHRAVWVLSWVHQEAVVAGARGLFGVSAFVCRPSVGRGPHSLEGAVLRRCACVHTYVHVCARVRVRVHVQCGMVCCSACRRYDVSLSDCLSCVSGPAAVDDDRRQRVHPKLRGGHAAAAAPHHPVVSAVFRGEVQPREHVP